MDSESWYRNPATSVEDPRLCRGYERCRRMMFVSMSRSDFRARLENLSVQRLSRPVFHIRLSNSADPGFSNFLSFVTVTSTTLLQLHQRP